MANLSTNEKQILEKLFQMNGHVLNFTNRTMGEFFADDLKINIYDDKYAYASGSKASYVRGFWQVANDNLVGKSIEKLIEYIENQILIGGLEKKDFSDDLIRRGKEIANKLLGKKNVAKFNKDPDKFLETEYKFSLSNLQLDGSLIPVIEQRIGEIERGFKAKNPLSVVLLCGSTLEGILLGVAVKNISKFNQTNTAPKDKSGKVLPINNWKLTALIDVAHELNLLDLDVKKHSHTLRDFRNYIHPFQQMTSQFHPTEDTAKISFQVLKAAIAQLSKNA